MKKRILTIFIVSLCLMLSTASFAFAAPDSSTKAKITKDTVITQGNLKDVAKYLGLDYSKFTKNDEGFSSKSIVTVGEFENAIAYGEQALADTAKEGVALSNSASTDGLVSTMASGSKSCVTWSDYGDLIACYTANGNWQSFGEDARWTSAGPGSVSVSSDSGTVTWDITAIRSMSNTLINGSTSSAYLHFTPDYTATMYIIVLGLKYEVGSDNISCSLNFNNSWIY
ncbi:hypothetical protein [Dehalobacter restrictus]|uniref:Uncharacterized protein n=1 Tax=Dehalobacter restrictus TaxID=55583 RepID=A0A857DM56_9FIRM|nr:hypothetical protein [Dehalobacter restrictus]QHA01678.1 hypothetical protein GQ588_14020 [Dehalobacter restrictus]